VDQWWQLLDELTYTFRDGVMLQVCEQYAVALLATSFMKKSFH
jgi:hypothetical protein